MSKDSTKIAIVAIARLENDYINEWIGHHLNIGVEHIYVFDNSSCDEEKLNGIIYEKYLHNVTIIPSYDKEHYQMTAYKKAYKKYGNLYDYFIYIDIDEFIMLKSDKTIIDFVNRLPDDCECYRMNWMIYGDSDIINRDVSSSVIKDFTIPSFNTKRNTVTKSIIKGGLNNIDFKSVHYPIFNNGGKVSNLITYYGDMINITDDLSIKEKSINIKHVDYTYIQLNHYITKSLCEFLCCKMRRKDAAWNYKRNIDKDFFIYNKKTEEKEKVFKESLKHIKYFYWTPKKYENIGDYYNIILMNKLYYCNCDAVTERYKNLDMCVCGSILTSKSIVYSKYIVGCGVQNNKKIMNTNGNAYLAVRGKMTKERLLSSNIKVNDIKFVDPGLLVSKIYDFGNITHKYKIGIIPHNNDDEIIKQMYGNDYKIISMIGTDVQMVCREIKECDLILSSSLHGIIFSHSLGVPAYHIELSKLQDGDNFKFMDYYTCYNNIEYKNFKCDDYVIPFNEILKFDKSNREKCNPSKSQVIKKQNEFLSVLPFKEKLNKKFLCDNYEEVLKEFISKKPEEPKIEKTGGIWNKQRQIKARLNEGSVRAVKCGNKIIYV